MEFGFSEEQQELASTVRSLLAKRADSAAVRAAAESETGYDEPLWQLLCEQIGVAALGIPEEYDGAGFTLFESLVALEEVGRSLAPSPLLASLVAAEALLAGGDDDAKQRLLPRIAAGEVATVSVRRRPALFADQATVLLAIDGDALLELDRRRVTRNGCRPWTRPTVSGHSTPRAAPGSATGRPRRPGPSSSGRSVSPRSRPAVRPEPST